MYDVACADNGCEAIGFVYYDFGNESSGSEYSGAYCTTVGGTESLRGMYIQTTSPLHARDCQMSDNHVRRYERPRPVVSNALVRLRAVIE